MGFGRHARRLLADQLHVLQKSLAAPMGSKAMWQLHTMNVLHLTCQCASLDLPMLVTGFSA